MDDPTAPGRTWEDSTRGGGDGTASTLDGDTFGDALAIPSDGAAVDTSYEVDMRNAEQARKVAEQATATAAEIMDRTGMEWAREDAEEPGPSPGPGPGLTDYEQRLAAWQAGQIQVRDRVRRDAEAQRAAAERLATGAQPQPVRARIRQPTPGRATGRPGGRQRGRQPGQLQQGRQPGQPQQGRLERARRQLPRPPGARNRTGQRPRRRDDSPVRRNAMRIFWILLVIVIFFGGLIQSLLDSLN